MSYIKCNKISKFYGQGRSMVSAIENICFNVDEGEFITIMGESGAGKSTLLAILGAINEPTTGQFIVDGLDIYGLKQEQQADFRREYLGFVFQSFYLMPYLSVEENVMLPLVTLSISKREKRDMAMDALVKVGLGDKGKRLPDQISGGEKERVAIARALVNKPPILLADEPTGNLDSKTSNEIMEFFQQLNESGMTILMVTHNTECMDYSSRRILLSDGMVVEDINLDQRSKKNIG